jgi:L-threonylcarbamoyladenylate synthase
MLRVSIDPSAPDLAILRRAAQIILDGGIVALPTDTLYGLAVDPFEPEAVDRLYSVKRRPGGLLIPLIAADEAQVEQHVGRMSPMARRLAARFWPGPLTLVIEASPRLAPSIHRGSGRVAVRVPDHAVARGLAEVAGQPLTSTSANRSGQPAPSTADEVEAALADSIDLLLDGGPTPGRLPSTIVDVVDPSPRLVRAGAVAWERVLESCEDR